MTGIINVVLTIPHSKNKSALYFFQQYSAFLLLTIIICNFLCVKDKLNTMILLSKKHYAKYKLKSLSGLRPPLMSKK